MVMNTLEEIIDKGVYDAFRLKNPSHVYAIRDLIAMGQTPTDIERQMIRMFGEGQISRDARHIADHLARIG
jgi:hypothetical protein